MDEHTRPDPARSALLTIDLQRDFLSDGAFAVPGTTEVLPGVRDLVRTFRGAGRPVVHLVRLYRPDGRDADRCRRALLSSGAPIVLPHSAGAELAPGLLPDDAVRPDDDLLLAGAPQRVGPDEHVLFKPRWSAFHRTVLEDHLHARNVSTVVVVGCNYPNCPRASLVDATQHEFRTVAVPDATSGWTAAASAELRSIGVAVLPVIDMIALLAAPPGKSGAARTPTRA